MASADTIRKGIIALLKMLEVEPKPVRNPLAVLKNREESIAGGKVPVDTPPNNPTGAQTLQQKMLAEQLGLELSPRPKAPAAQGTIRETRTRGEGPGNLSSSGAPIKDPLEDAVRSKKVIDQLEDLMLNDLHTEGVARGKGKNLRTPKSILEEQALEQIEAPKTFPKKPKRVGHRERKSFAQKKAAERGEFKPRGNPEIKTQGPSQGFGEIELDKTAGKVKGDFTLDELVTKEVDESIQHGARKGAPGKGGPQKFRDEAKRNELDLTGDDIAIQDEAIQIRFQIDKLQQELSNDVGGAIQPVIKKSGQAFSINEYIQDVFTRFNNLFKSKDFRQLDVKGKDIKLIQGSSASKLVDTRQSLRDLAEFARNPNLSKEDRVGILKRILKIDNEMTGSNAKLSDLGEKNYTSGDTLPATAKAFDDDTGKFGEAIAVSSYPAPDANISFQGDPGRSTRSLTDMINQRINEAKQGPPIARALGDAKSQIGNNTRRITPKQFDPTQLGGTTISPEDFLFNQVRKR